LQLNVSFSDARIGSCHLFLPGDGIMSAIDFDMVTNPRAIYKAE
jgi:hypothetical protein